MEAQQAIRRSWTHGELARAAAYIVRRERDLRANPAAALPKTLQAEGPLPDIAANDPHMVQALVAFGDLQTIRDQADYDHAANFDKAALLSACQKADGARQALHRAGVADRQAFFTLLTVRQSDFASR